VRPTSFSLLDRLKVAGPEAADWNRLQGIYLPLIERWLSRVPGLGDESADVAQEVLVVVFREVRTGDLSSAEFHRLRGLFLADVKRRLLRPIRALNADYQMDSDLITKHGTSRHLRTLDALQLAVALRVHRTTSIDHFVCAGQRLCDIAALEGLSVINPERR
jgi:hypothetical protein